MKILIYEQRRFLAIRPEMSVLTIIAMKLFQVALTL